MLLIISSLSGLTGSPLKSQDGEKKPQQQFYEKYLHYKSKEMHDF